MKSHLGSLLLLILSICLVIGLRLADRYLSRALVAHWLFRAMRRVAGPAGFREFIIDSGAVNRDDHDIALAHAAKCLARCDDERRAAIEYLRCTSILKCGRCVHCLSTKLEAATGELEMMRERIHKTTIRGANEEAIRKIAELQAELLEMHRKAGAA